MQEVSPLSMHNSLIQQHGPPPPPPPLNHRPFFIVNHNNTNQQYVNNGYPIHNSHGFQNHHHQLQYFQAPMPQQPLRKESQSSTDQINEFSNLQININKQILPHNQFNSGIPPPPPPPFQNQPLVPQIPYQMPSIINSHGMPPQLTHVILNQNGSHFQNQVNSNMPINHPMSNVLPNFGRIELNKNYQSIENQHQNFSNKVTIS